MEDDTKITLEEISCEGMDWINLSQYKDKWWAVVNTLLKVWFP
jgi:hypothetical protein